ncbi:MAG: phospholipid carrier-dependent glycosyltransferase [Proteobacteria bacterium]|nr:phospholipid carrier-dependent glycosyltransferase [Pseudomonadota bacterium]
MAYDLAKNGGWFDFAGNTDLFYFPPLFNYFAALLCKMGMDRLFAVRMTAMLFSSGIAPLLYILTMKSGHSRTTGIIAALLWTIAPISFCYSIYGQVDTAMIFFILLAAYHLQKLSQSQHPIRTTILCAMSLGAAIWIKETALGFVFIFLLLLLNNKKQLLYLGVSLTVILSPLIVQGFLTSEYNLVSEISPSRGLFAVLGTDKILKQLGAILGLSRNTMPHVYLTLLFFMLSVITFSIFSLTRAQWKRSFILRFGMLALIVFIPFFVLYPKKCLYYILLVYVFLAVPMSLFLVRRKILCTVFVILTLFLSFNTMAIHVTKEKAPGLLRAFHLIQKNTSHAKLAMARPRVAQYWLEKKRFDISIVEVPIFKSGFHTSKREFLANVILKSDYYFGTEMFLKAVFCIPGKVRKCKNHNYNLVKTYLKQIKKWGSYKLYKITAKTPDDMQLASVDRALQL